MSMHWTLSAEGVADIATVTVAMAINTQCAELRVEFESSAP
jgi:hypothetical protein